MTIEAGVTYISDLNATYPAAGDAKSEGDDHIRNIKSAIKASFTGVTGAVTVTHTELNRLAGITSGVVSLNNAQTLTNKVLTSPSIGTGIYDTNGNALFVLTATASSVNYLTYVNAAAGNPAVPTFTATTAGQWDSATWDVGMWGGDPVIQKNWQSVMGIGYCAGIHMLAATNAGKIEWSATDFAYKGGGIL